MERSDLALDKLNATDFKNIANGILGNSNSKEFNGSIKKLTQALKDVYNTIGSIDNNKTLIDLKKIFKKIQKKNNMRKLLFLGIILLISCLILISCSTDKGKSHVNTNEGSLEFSNYKKLNHKKIDFKLEINKSYKVNFTQINGNDQVITIFYDNNDSLKLIKDTHIIRKDTNILSYTIRGVHEEINSLVFNSSRKVFYKNEIITIYKYKMVSKETDLTTYYYWNDKLGFIAFENYGNIFLIANNSQIYDKDKITYISKSVFNLICKGWNDNNR